MLDCLQLLRWSDKGPEETPTIDVTISSKQQLNGVLAALAVLYHEEQLLREVAQQDLVSAVVYGDQLAIPRAVELGMQLLKEAAGRAGAMKQECFAALAALPAWPTCMLPLVPLVAAQYSLGSKVEQQQPYQAVLVSALGDLEAVWGDPQLQKQLLALPPAAAALLLFSDNLRVVSEDTVLYTALRYLEQQDSVQGREAARKTLSQCIRCVRLNQRNLLAIATAADSPLFSKEQQELLLQVLSLCLVSTEHCVAAAASSSSSKVPKAWLRAQRTSLVPASPKSMVWRVKVADIKAACRGAAARPQGVELSSSVITGPVSGLAFGLVLKAFAEPEPSGTSVGVYVDAKCMARPCINLRFQVAAVNTGCTRTLTKMLGKSYGWSNYFNLPPMGGDGWDEAAWAAKGLPVAGHLELQLTVGQL
jgi:hypothetical protein